MSSGISDSMKTRCIATSSTDSSVSFTAISETSLGLTSIRLESYFNAATKVATSAALTTSKLASTTETPSGPAAKVRLRTLKTALLMSIPID